MGIDKRTVEGRADVDSTYRLSRRNFLISTGALIAASACSTAPPQQATQNLPEGTVKLSAWTIGPDAPSYYRRDNLIAAGETLGKAVAAQSPKTSIQVDATLRVAGSGATTFRSSRWPRRRRRRRTSSSRVTRTSRRGSGPGTSSHSTT